LDDPQKSRLKRFAIAIFAIVTLMYFRSLNYPFAFDDTHSIVSNAAIQLPKNLLKIWTAASFCSSSPENWGYRPLMTMSHSIAWIVGGGATWPFRIEKIFLFSGVGFLLFLIWSRLFKTPGFYPNPSPRIGINWRSRPYEWSITPEFAAAILAVLFVVHPANTQIVLYIAATSTLLCGFWYLVAYYLYLRFRESGDRRELIGVCLAFFLSVMAKEEGITLPAVVVLTEFFLPAPKSKAIRTQAITSVALTGIAAALLLRFMFAETSNLARGDATRWEYFLTQIRAYPHYLRLAIWPSGLNADNTEFGFSTSIRETNVLVAIAINAALVFLAFARRKRNPIFLFSLLWFYIAISPASSIVPLAEPVNDHRMTLAYFGLFGALIPALLIGIERLFPAPHPLAAERSSGWVLSAVFLGLIITTEVRIPVWSSPEALWTDTSDRNPNSGRAQNNLAISYFSTGDYAQAKTLLDQCERVRPNYPVCKINLGEALSFLGRESEAESKYQEAIRLAPYDESARYFYARFLFNRGRYTTAKAMFHDIVELTHGTYLDAALDEAQCEKRLGNESEAEAILTKLEMRFPNHPKVIAARRNP
jgi:Tfp pilus assembly protein PilF